MEWEREGIKDSPGIPGLELFCILTVVVVTQIYTQDKTALNEMHTM